MPASSSKLSHQVVALGITQTIAWASSTYLPAILAEPIAHDLGISRATVFGAFSVALVVMAVSGPPAGRAIDAHGGRRVLALSNLVLAAGLALLAATSNVALLFGAWCVLGVGMALGLYDAAFATLVRLHGHGARAPITGITLIAGFASTVGWPLTTWLSAHYGWRACCLTWAAIHLVLALPVNLIWIPRGTPANAVPANPAPAKGEPGSAAPAPPQSATRTFVLLSIFFATTAFITSAMAAHLPGLLVATGVTTAVAVTAGALLGPAQVAARLAEFGIAHRFRIHPLVTARIASALHPAGAALIALLFGAPFGAFGFAVLHGAGNGMITIAKGTLPLALFGPVGYGARTGLLSVAGRGMQAVAPFAFGLVLELWGAGAALAVSATLSLVALGALLGLRATAADSR